jgi:hypothetical protein
MPLEEAKFGKQNKDRKAVFNRPFSLSEQRERD